MSSPSKKRLDNESVQKAYQDYVPSLERFLIGVLKDHGAVSDVLQITFTRLLEQGGEVKSGSLRAWLFRVAYNEAMLVHRKQKVDRRAKDAIAWQLGPAVDDKNEGFVSLVQEERAELVRNALETLPVEQKRIVKLRIHDGLKFIEIAQKLDLPLGTVLTRMRSGLKKLKDQLKQL